MSFKDLKFLEKKVGTLRHIFNYNVFNIGLHNTLKIVIVHHKQNICTL